MRRPCHGSGVTGQGIGNRDSGMGYTPGMIPVGSHPVWHPVFETLAYAAGYAVFGRNAKRVSLRGTEVRKP
jgi:hypothetical protein